MENIAFGGIELAWDPDSRLATLGFRKMTKGTGKDATRLVEAMSRWIGPDPKPFGLLGDGGKLAGVDAEYRSVWARFLREHRNQCSIAFFDMGVVVRIAAEMFRIGTGVRMRAFAKEDDARAWLREMGLNA